MTPDSVKQLSPSRLTGALVALIVSLMLVGVVSQTLFRHLLQVSPALIVLAAALRRARWAADAAHPVFLFWLLLMSMLWIQLLGWHHFVNGSFSPVEIALTIAIGVSAFWGLLATGVAFTGGSVRRVLWFLAFGLLQWMAFWASMRQSISRH